MLADLGITMLAAGIGNIHGKYPANWKGLSFETLDAVQQKTGDMPLVLHGGTGFPEDMIKKAISLGVAKINVNTECQLSFAAATSASRQGSPRSCSTALTIRSKRTLQRRRSW